MERKIYGTDRERKIDQIIGFLSFLVINAFVLLTIHWKTEGFQQDVDTPWLLLPWLANGGFIALAFALRPQIGVGYLTSFAAIVVGAVALGILFLAACTIAPILTIPFRYLDEELGMTCCVSAFFILFLVGLLLIGWGGTALLAKWWPPSKQLK